MRLRASCQRALARFASRASDWSTSAMLGRTASASMTISTLTS